MDSNKNSLSGKDSPVNLEDCSSQVRELCHICPEYRAQVETLWANTANNSGPRELRRRGYAYLVSLFYGMPKRAEVQGKAMSPEFGDLTFFARYVGPRPTAKHTLHRMHNDVGYRIGNVEWADKRKQAEERSTTQHHLYLGRRLTDRQLAEVIAKHGGKITAGAIKKQRQRKSKLHLSPVEITKAIFDKFGIPYATSQDPIEAWNFPIEFHSKLTQVYPHFRGTKETRIEFFVRWLDDQILSLAKEMGKAITSAHQKDKLAPLIDMYRHKAQETRAVLQSLHQMKMDKVIAEAASPFSPAQKVFTSTLPPETQPSPQVPSPTTPEPEKDDGPSEEQRMRDVLWAINVLTRAEY